MAQEPVLPDEIAARIVEIGEGCRHVSFVQGSIAMAAEDGGTERVPIREIAGLVASRPGLSWSGPALTALTENRVGIVLCGPNHRSSIMTWPVPSRRWPSRIRAQLGLDPPFGRYLLRLLEKAGQSQRVAVLQAMGKGDALQAQVKAQRPVRGLHKPRLDTTILDALLERHYWPWLVGTGFRRDPRRPGANAVVNCGHTELRIAATRAVHAAGLHPSVGLRGRVGRQGLVDELMIPYRPVVDLAAAVFVATGHAKVNAAVRGAFERLFTSPLRGPRGPMQISLALEELARSVGDSLETGNARLELLLPARQDPDTLFAMLTPAPES